MFMWAAPRSVDAIAMIVLRDSSASIWVCNDFYTIFLSLLVFFMLDDYDNWISCFVELTAVVIMH